MYILIGIILLGIVAIFIIADKVAPTSAMMSSFKKGTYKKFMIGMSIAALLSISYGIYYSITYQPPFLDITIEDNEYTIFGEIGELGYFSDSLVRQGQATNLYLASWEELGLNQNVQLIVEYPSGKEEIWWPTVSIIEPDKLQNKYGIKEVYRCSPYMFVESGEVQLTVQQNNHAVTSLTIEVHSK
ncbi:hypothetical protein GH754_11615 [Salinibacillus xinjiangensis]|uniref:Uncharacterized protein n=1 Tax=Salinibacillus xinjiangensis TaxID=1229268 RepID=A0A6G1X7N6_9BACI|nr:hypothetical protein [Salinibacillus xinjiangensis]